MLITPFIYPNCFKSRENLSKLSEAATVFMAMTCQEVKFSDFQVYEKILWKISSLNVLIWSDRKVRFVIGG